MSRTIFVISSMLREQTCELESNFFILVGSMVGPGFLKLMSNIHISKGELFPMNLTLRNAAYISTK